MFKKILVIFLVSIFIPCFAADNLQSKLSKIEDSVLGIDYPKEKTEYRLDRLEKNIYGKPKTGSIQSRLNKIEKDIASDVLGQEIKPSEDTFLSEEDYVKSDGSENYPVINEIETKLFTQIYPEKNLRNRLSDIEKNLFKKSYDGENYFDRMERIKHQYYKLYPPVAENYDNFNNYTNNQTDDIKSFYSSPFASRYDKDKSTGFSKYNSKDEYDLYALEEKLLKNTYPNESFNERLSRLEQKVFETDFFYDDEKIRLDRLSEAVSQKRFKKRIQTEKLQNGINSAITLGSVVLMILALIL